MKKYSCLIVDDEALARTLLETFAQKLPQLTITASCKNPLEAIEVLNTEKIDLIFLDIQMPELTGIEFLQSLSQRPAVIFTTAYPDYALEGYALNVIDYLLKPFSFQRFTQAVNKATELIELRQKGGDNFEKDYLLIKADHKVYKLKFDDLLYIQGMREYVTFYTKTQGKVMALYALKKLETELPSQQFLRVHKSYIVAIPQVSMLEGNLLHIGSETIPIGANYKEEVLERIF